MLHREHFGLLIVPRCYSGGKSLTISTVRRLTEITRPTKSTMDCGSDPHDSGRSRSRSVCLPSHDTGQSPTPTQNDCLTYNHKPPQGILSNVRKSLYLNCVLSLDNFIFSTRQSICIPGVSIYSSPSYVGADS